MRMCAYDRIVGTHHCICLFLSTAVKLVWLFYNFPDGIFRPIETEIKKLLSTHEKIIVVLTELRSKNVIKN